MAQSFTLHLGDLVRAGKGKDQDASYHTGDIEKFEHKTGAGVGDETVLVVYVQNGAVLGVTFNSQILPFRVIKSPERTIIERLKQLYQHNRQGSITRVAGVRPKLT